MFTIYLITNKLNNKVYVGQTCETVHRRWLRHLNQTYCDHRVEYNTHFHRAVRKHGKENFEINELAVVPTLQEVCTLEKLWITTLRARQPEFGYNSAFGGETNKGYKRSPEAIKLTSNANRGSHRSEESRRKMSEWQKGLKRGPQSSERIQKRVEARLRNTELGVLSPRTIARKERKKLGTNNP